MSPMRTSGTDTGATSPNVFELAVNRYGFTYPVFDEDNGDRVEGEVSEDEGDTKIEYADKNAEKMPPVAQTLNREREREIDR